MTPNNGFKDADNHNLGTRTELIYFNSSSVGVCYGLKYDMDMQVYFESDSKSISSITLWSHVEFDTYLKDNLCFIVC